VRRRRDLQAVVETAVPVTTSTLRGALAVPSIVANAGDRASRRFLEFFAASIDRRPQAYDPEIPLLLRHRLRQDRR
jgi:hypothetical protein